MRNNQPVTQQEFDFPDDVTLMSTTDADSVITYANTTFAQVSGFANDELVGQPHNVVRHPDMPRDAFADMWTTLRNGEPWTALVKNRRKNGDHYWVRANAIPIVRNGVPQGYMSVRTKAPRDEIDAADALYRAFREGKARGRRFHKGLIVRTGLLRVASLSQTMSVRWRVHAALLVLAPAVVAAGWASGLAGAGLAAFAAATAGVATAAGLWLDAQIVRPLKRLHEQALNVATGASRRGVRMNRVDEIGMTLRTINQLGLMFRWLVDDVSEQVRNVQRASNEIAQGNDDLSARTEQAASSVQQTAASMAEMTATVDSNTETALQANRLAVSASDAAERGGQVVSEVVATMRDITDSSRRIADIIGVIDGIAFQTNILALNAAVEAARAGEQGRGFAVVAGEVRALAQRSANAAKEIKTLIGASVDRVESGVRRVDEAGRTMDDIVAQVKRVSDLIAEISASTAEQSTGVAQVDQAVVHLDNITQQNAALVEQSAAASAGLKQQATRLVDAVNVFR
ncbi:PAS domain-containing protein [Burkholderia dolosa]|uniref:PAS domain-containing protein n=1 Tax=Burkholderia dolosa TaxID=152500 RepID=A0A892I8G5_9BURK|nr:MULTISPECIES: PAS domain-containing methyl-accepting chemotaxis protein [Burkholderia]AKE04934.1 aerotaxis receptor Aer [Burkholderia cepacia]AJY10424.1 sensory box protein [Burkholderia dolosa AU0158]AYZ94764.1 PAS domain S-box protein [Burkholderia dolosa]ETP63182.1 aerotaxis receptor [Burkholderia dolosa PC543]MBR8416216.1 PAS domain-containing protein [Burkholderia dolosa]